MKVSKVYPENWEFHQIFPDVIEPALRLRVARATRGKYTRLAPARPIIARPSCKTRWARSRSPNYMTLYIHIWRGRSKVPPRATYSMSHKDLEVA